MRNATARVPATDVGTVQGRSTSWSSARLLEVVDRLEPALGVREHVVHHRHLVIDERTHPLDHHVGPDRPPLVLAHVLGPGVDDERLDEPVGRGEVAEQAPR